MDDDPADREEGRALRMAELDRMNRMGNNVIMLAKADRPDFLTVGEVDLADLTVDVAARSRGLGARRWRVGAVARCGGAGTRNA